MMRWLVELDTGRFGDWIFVDADTEDEARRKARRSSRRGIRNIRITRPTSEWLAMETEPKRRRTRR